MALKQQIIEDVKRCVEKFNSVYVFSVENMRNELMKDLRLEWKPSRFFFGKNRVIALGFGRTAEEEVGVNLHKLAACLKGQCGLLFTDTPKDEVAKWFKEYTVDDYARSGYKAPMSISLPKGPLAQFAHSMEPFLRKLGMPTSLDRGVITLLKEYEVCKEGNVLTPEQAKILKLLDHKLAPFKLVLKAVWSKDEGFEKLSSDAKEEDEDSGEMECENDD